MPESSALTATQAYDLRRTQATALAATMDVPAFLARLDAARQAVTALREALDAAVDLLPGALDGGGEEPAGGYHRELAEALAAVEADTAPLADSLETLKQVKGMLRAVYQPGAKVSVPAGHLAEVAVSGNRASLRV